MNPLSGRPTPNYTGSKRRNRQLFHAVQKLHLDAIPGEGDPLQGSFKYQTLLEAFARQLGQSGIQVYPRLFTWDGQTSSGLYAGSFVISTSQAIRHILSVLLMAWLRGCHRRMVRLDVGDRTMDAQTDEDVDRLLDFAARYATVDDDPTDQPKGQE
jgi:hypothetical protein